MNNLEIKLQNRILKYKSFLLIIHRFLIGSNMNNIHIFYISIQEAWLVHFTSTLESLTSCESICRQNVSLSYKAILLFPSSQTKSRCTETMCRCTLAGTGRTELGLPMLILELEIWWKNAKCRRMHLNFWSSSYTVLATCCTRANILCWKSVGWLSQQGYGWKDSSNILF